MKGSAFVDEVKRAVGFQLLQTFTEAFAGVRVYAKTLVCDLEGNILREAQPEDIAKWNTTWNKLAQEAFDKSRSNA